MTLFAGGESTPWPPIEWWTGPVDWIYCPAEYFVAARRARLAVTSHDVLQTLRFESPRKRELLGRIFARADLILSVSHYNTQQLLEAFSDPGASRGVCAQWCRRSLFSAGARARAQPHPCRPGAAAQCAVPNLGCQLSAAQEPAAAGQGRRAASRGRFGRARASC